MGPVCQLMAQINSTAAIVIVSYSKLFPFEGAVDDNSDEEDN